MTMHFHSHYNINLLPVSICKYAIIIIILSCLWHCVISVQRVDFMKTALDTTVKGRYVDLTVLTQDENGQISEQFSSGEDQKQPNLEEGKEESGEALYRKIAQSDFEVRNLTSLLAQVLL